MESVIKTDHFKFQSPLMGLGTWGQCCRGRFAPGRVVVTGESRPLSPVLELTPLVEFFKEALHFWYLDNGLG